MVFLEHLLFAFNVLFPLLLLAFLGGLLRTKNIIQKPFVDQLNGFIFNIALPVMIFHTLASSDGFASITVGVFIFVATATLFITGIGFLLVRLKPWDKATKPVVLQSLFRGNYVIIGMPLALRLGGQEALAVLVVLNALMIPLTNLLSYVTFSLFQDNQSDKTSFSLVLKRTFFNPIMISVVLGMVAYLFTDTYTRLTSTVTVIPDTMAMIQATVTPMALLAIGAQFQFKKIQAVKAILVFAVISRMVVVPLMVFSMAYLLRHQIDFSQSWIALVALFASPVAVASVAVTKGLNGDDELASQLVILDTAVALFTVFIAIVWMRSMGLF